MPSTEPAKKARRREIVGIAVAGYKSIWDEQEIEFRPLTILAGANSSGKSSMIQPLLLLKQTLDAGYDPGPLLINGPNVRFTSAEQFISARLGARAERFSIALRLESGETVGSSFRKRTNHPLELVETSFKGPEGSRTLRPEIAPEDLLKEILASLPPEIAKTLDNSLKGWQQQAKGRVVRDRCFLTAEFRVTPDLPFPAFGFGPAAAFTEPIRELIHLPGLRGNPERTYPVSAVGHIFPGAFSNYVASIVAQWQAAGGDRRLGELNRDLEQLGLTWKVDARPASDTEVELRVGRLPHAERSGARDLVSIADVGFGVSQVLPLVVALHTARPGQLVYVEQPELHLHPRAQRALADVLAKAAARNVTVIAETHSATLLLAIQALVAENKLPRDKVKLHWFERGADGMTRITSADLDEKGAFGDWPEDFGQVALETESRYLDAVEARHGG